jgi:uncharacterized membrane protein
VTKVIVVGESWVSAATHYKGWDHFASASYQTGVSYLRSALESAGVELVHMPAHEAAEGFPFEASGLAGYDVVILSDIGANTLLLHPDTWMHGRRMPNRLTLLREWTEAGGGLAMAGGYFSFQGLDGRARYRGTAVEAVLPAEIDPWDDRVEVPEGFSARVVAPDHPVVAGLELEWPPLLGYNRFRTKDDATVLASFGDDPVLAVRHAGAGRTLAWASDIGPHWCPEEFASWSGFGRLWAQAVAWLAGSDAE